jgi:hypothetical protein
MNTHATGSTAGPEGHRSTRAGASEDDLRLIEFQLRRARRELREAQQELNKLGETAARSSRRFPEAIGWLSPVLAVVAVALLLNFTRILNIYAVLAGG